ncbi:N,N'-diacetylchitobiose transport system permease protein [Microbacterium terrae]|uniref:Trehalose transport system permease protein SugB n=1 Tax=Microbacterium terrae TaxID=69369 RepID=A0A0M2H640_9MICO|nr:carbohydrate ABC transporter permease [Microbacterium terrae]KJL39506.1 Trehalose transport system permease protein SugB [Microbacterium terrae]MBP1078098.1 N,N'-diacetylchitobiose transport system permease protein [Microbacterium terrae]GLK00267.1 sugar ABC transporter permease [Microbacterium terrae]
MSTQVSAGTQLTTIGVDEVIGDIGSAKTPKRGSIDARRPSPRRVVTRTVLNIMAAIVFVCSIFPVYWMINLSFTRNDQIISREPDLLPLQFTLNNYITAWNREAAPGQTDFTHALGTTVMITGGVLVATLLFAFLASIAVARFAFKGRKAFIISVLVVQMIPGEAMMFTIYSMLDDWRLVNTMLGLGIVYLASVIPFTIWTLRGFVAGVPADLEEAAMIDGCTKSQAFWKVTFPLLAPGLVSTGIFAFIQAWNEFTMALLLMRGYNLTLMPWLNAFTSSSASGSVNWGAVMAGSTMISIPVIIFFLIVQGRMTGGLVSGAVKG